MVKIHKLSIFLQMIFYSTCFYGALCSVKLIYIWADGHTMLKSVAEQIVPKIYETLKDINK
jgi:hypothetical protein